MSDTKKIFAANWKLNKTPLEAKSFCEELLAKVNPDFFLTREIFIFPQNFSVGLVAQTCKGSPIKVGPQNIHFEKKGAFTGENSALICKEFGCVLALLGHSERRQYFQESGIDLTRKFLLVQELAMLPVLCVGETLAEREANKTDEVVFQQLEEVLGAVDSSKRTVIAYEPVWAIGTGKVATLEQVADVHKKIYQKMHDLGFKNFQILYGGSVKSDNAGPLLQVAHVDGFLIGGASLEVESFLEVCKA